MTMVEGMPVFFWFWFVEEEALSAGVGRSAARRTGRRGARATNAPQSLTLLRAQPQVLQLEHGRDHQARAHSFQNKAHRQRQRGRHLKDRDGQARVEERLGQARDEREAEGGPLVKVHRLLLLMF